MVLEQYTAEAIEAKKAELTAQLQEFEAIAREQARTRVEVELTEKRAQMETLQADVDALEAELSAAVAEEVATEEEAPEAPEAPDVPTE